VIDKKHDYKEVPTAADRYIKILDSRLGNDFEAHKMAKILLSRR